MSRHNARVNKAALLQFLHMCWYLGAPPVLSAHCSDPSSLRGLWAFVPEMLHAWAMSMECSWSLFSAAACTNTFQHVNKLHSARVKKHLIQFNKLSPLCYSYICNVLPSAYMV